MLVRTEDDTKLDALQAAGATEIVPAIFETSLSLVSHVLLFLRVPPEEVLATTEEIRHERYAILRSVFRRRAARAIDETHSHRQQLHTVVLPPGAQAIDRSILELGLDHGPVIVSAIRREGITGRDPDPDDAVTRRGRARALGRARGHRARRGSPAHGLTSAGW